MSEVQQIAEELRSIHEGDPWHGPSLKRTLEGISAERAASRPIPAAHGIWELVLHIGAWENAAMARMEGRIVKQPEEGDFPAVKDRTAAAWEEAQSRLHETHARLIALIADLNDGGLESRVAGTDYSLRFLLRGVICHHAYHSGQIALLRKA
jgi:hypothetical protein